MRIIIVAIYRIYRKKCVTCSSSNPIFENNVVFCSSIASCKNLVTI